MKKIYLPILFFLMILQWSCEENEIIDPLDNNITENQKLKIPNLEKLDLDMIPPFISDKLSKFQKSFKIKSSNFGTILPNSKILKVQKGDSVSYTFLLSNDNSLKQNEQENIYIDNLVFFQNGKSESTFILRYVPEMYWYKGSRNFSNYSGKVEVYDDEGERIGNVTMDEGVLQPQNTTKTGGSCELEFDPGPIICTELIDESGDSYGLNCTQTYDVIITCSSSGGGDSGGDYDPNNPPGGDNPGEFPDGPGQGGITPPNWPDPEEDEETEEYTFQVTRDTSFTNIDKINCTYERLLNNNQIAEVLADFFGEDAFFDVTFNVVENLNCNGNSNATGCTTPLGGNAYRIDIDEDYINDPNTPTIFLAQTLIHESIHANLFAAVKKLNNGITPTDTSFEALYEDYRDLKNWSHEMMAEHYTDIMQETMREVHPNLNDDQFLNYYDDNILWDWDEFYEYMSYRGLDGTEGGDEYFDNTNNISLYKEGVEAYSTKQPNCY